MKAHVALYTSAFWSSSCCRAPFTRLCVLGQKDIFICRACGSMCKAVQD